MKRKNYLQQIALLMAITVFSTIFSGCRRTKSHKEYVTSEYDVVMEDNTSNDQTSEGSSGTVDTAPGDHSSSGSSGGLFNGGAISAGKRVTLECPYIIWAASEGQRITFDLYQNEAAIATYGNIKVYTSATIDFAEYTEYPIM